jgi:hypothetical protein
MAGLSRQSPVLSENDDRRRQTANGKGYIDGALGLAPLAQDNPGHPN